MIRIKPPVVVIATQEARAAIGARVTELAYCAYREIAMAAKGLEIAHLQFVFGKTTFAACSRLRRDGTVEIEIGLGDPRLPASTFTLVQLRAAERRAALAWRHGRG
jgi:hypothetical protein